MDQFIGNWYALRADHETALSYDNVPDLIEFIISSQMDSTWHLYYNFNMRRDMEAWYQDALGNNLITLDNDFDINIPFHFFLRYYVNPVAIKIGRFPILIHVMNIYSKFGINDLLIKKKLPM